jgi:hypothetical protein
VQGPWRTHTLHYYCPAHRHVLTYWTSEMGIPWSDSFLQQWFSLFVRAIRWLHKSNWEGASTCGTDEN